MCVTVPHEPCEFPVPHTFPTSILRSNSKVVPSSEVTDGATMNAGATASSDGAGVCLGAVNTAETLGGCYDIALSCGGVHQDPLHMAESVGNVTGKLVIDAVTENISSREGESLRLDIPYSIKWLEEHIALLDSIMLEVDCLIDECTRRCDSDITFRSSVDKKVIRTSILPCNVTKNS